MGEAVEAADAVAPVVILQPLQLLPHLPNGAPRNLPAGAPALVDARSEELMRDTPENSRQIIQHDENQPLLRTEEIIERTRRRIFWCLTMILGVLILTALVFLFIVKNYPEAGMRDKFNVIKYEEWSSGPLPEGNLTKLDLPASTVIFYQTNTIKCNTHGHCSELMREIQERDELENGQESIAYNFVIAGKGLIYEGRGWKYRPFIPDGRSDGTIAIAFMGSFETVPPTRQQAEEARMLLTEAIHYGLIEKCCTILSYRHPPFRRLLLDVVYRIDEYLQKYFSCPFSEEALA